MTRTWRTRLSTVAAGLVAGGGLLASPASAGTTGSISVTPDAGLRDGQVVSTELVGPPDSDLLVIQCRNPISNFFTDCGGAFGVHSDSGTETMPFVVHRTFGNQVGTTVECNATHPCALTLWVYPSGSPNPPAFVDSAPISFSK